MQVIKCFFCSNEKGNFGAPQLSWLQTQVKSNLHEINEAKDVIVMDGEALKDCLIKSTRKMFDTGLKVTRVICTSVYEVQCTTTTLCYEQFY